MSGRRRLSDTSRTRAIADPLARWFIQSARPLPWRTSPRDPYRSLVSELMLQQTQVSRVLEKFGPFLRRFPTIHSLANADESDVLAEWSGLGYYRRARLLHAASKDIVHRFAGQIPCDLPALRSIPGIGPYTAGAIASIVFDRPAPIVDGNVLRVLSRVHARDGAADEAATVSWAWEQADHLANAAESPALTNEGIMELGATVCTPRNPRCDDCPLRGICLARATGTQAEIPRPKKAAERRTIHHASVLISDGSGGLLVEQRPSAGLWASMWQVPTLEREGEEPPTRPELAEFLGLSSPKALHLINQFTHTTTHRHVAVSAWALRSPTERDLSAASRSRPAGRFIELTAALTLALSNLQRRLLVEYAPSVSPSKTPTRKPAKPSTAKPKRQRRTPSIP